MLIADEYASLFVPTKQNAKEFVGRNALRRMDSLFNS
jgi:hypothetical protein